MDLRILMLSCNTGEGHNSTAKAIMEVLHARGVESVLVDVLNCLSPSFSKFVCNWHARLYKYAPKLWDAGYRVAERNTAEPDETTPLYELLALGARKLWQILLDGAYDAIICVHTFSALMMTEVRRSYGSVEPCFFVSTDYSVSPYLEQCAIDGYFIPAEDFVASFVEAGLPGNRLIASGIPVRQEFYRVKDPLEARTELNLPKQGPVVLLMCGSMGCGPIRKLGVELARRLPERGMVVAICGNNEKLYESMQEIHAENLRVLGYTTNIADYMSAADLIVTKPGGLSSTEAASKHLPMVLINAVGGCEAKNFERFLQRGYALGSKEPETVLEQTLALAQDPERLVQMRRNLAADFSRNSAAIIADRVMEAVRRQADLQALLH